MEKVVDILKHAIENELKAKVFYTQAADITSDGESQMVFMELTGMEDDHARLLVDRFGDLLQAKGFDARSYLNELEADIEKVSDYQDIVAAGVLGTPAVRIDGEVKIAGRVPKVEQVQAWLRGEE